MADSTNRAEEIANDFFKSHQVGDVKVSPDGKFIALMQSTGRASQLILINSSNFKKSLIMEDKFNDAIDIIDFTWIDNNSIILEAYVRGKGRALLLSKLSVKRAKLIGVENKYLLNGVFLANPIPKVKNKFLVGKSVDGNTSLYSMDITKNNLLGQLRSKYKLNKKAPKAQNWLTDTRGKLTLGYGLDKAENKNKVWVKDPKSKKWKLVWSGEQSITFKPVLISRLSNTIYVLSNEQSDLISLYEYDFAKKSYIKTIYESPNTDINSVIVSSDKKTILGVSYIEDGFVKRSYFSEVDALLSNELKLAMDESTPYIVDFNLDRTIAVVQTSTSTDPGTYHLFNSDTKELIKFASKAPWLKSYTLNSSQVIQSKSVDGKYIESYLTLPSKSEDTPPLIVLPHGGPISIRDTRHFNSHVQFLATLGYAVLQPNYRGSSGYGKKFKEQGMGEWGRLIEDDIQSSIKKVIKQGLVNPDKICIYGISYGGYSALISAINRPDLFKCAASYAGVTDLPLLFNNLELSKSERLNNLMKKIVGNPETELDTLIEYSPVYKSHKIEVPIFLAQGDEDTVVDIEHYYRMTKMMDAHGIMYRNLVLEGEAHGFKYLDSIVQFYTKLDSFFRHSLQLAPLK